MKSNKRKIQEIQEVFYLHRKWIIEACERAVDKQKKWESLRKEILRYLSPDRGLEQKVLEIFCEGEGEDEGSEY